MSERLRNNLLKYGICSAVCLAYAAIHCFSRGVTQMSPVDLYRTISDGFTVPGMLCIFAGLLVWLSNEGTFHGIGYVLKNAAKALMFFTRRGEVEKYADYVESRKGKKITGYSFLFVVGAVCLVITVVFVLLYEQAHG